jgi:hypothetical protein
MGIGQSEAFRVEPELTRDCALDMKHRLSGAMTHFALLNASYGRTLSFERPHLPCITACITA